jgi:hypothetical protein
MLSFVYDLIKSAPLIQIFQFIATKRLAFPRLFLVSTGFESFGVFIIILSLLFLMRVESFKEATNMISLFIFNKIICNGVKTFAKMLLFLWITWEFDQYCIEFKHSQCRNSLSQAQIGCVSCNWISAESDRMNAIVVFGSMKSFIDELFSVTK